MSATRDLIQVLLKGEPRAVRQAVQAAGGSIGTVVEDISTARVPLDAIRDVAAHPGVERMERTLQLVRTNDVAAGHVGAHAVLQGTAPLERAYTGAGVLVGIVDSGIDFRHGGFRDPDDPGRSRIIYIWDQADVRGPGPEEYGYGTMWTQEQIEGALEGQGNVRHLDEDGHGSHISGSAAGNGAAVGRYAGMAPRADIIAVVDDNETETSVVDAASFIYQIAQERGQPAVVNLSAGTHFGPHDDSGLEVQALNALVEAAPGRAFVASAGNEGSDFIHWGGFALEQDSLWTYYYVPAEAIFEDDTGGDLLGFAEFFSIVSAADVASTFIAMGIDRTRFRDFELTPLGYEGRTRWYSLRELIREEFGIFETLRYRSGRAAGEVCFAAQTLENGDVAICIYVTDFITSLDPRIEEPS